MKKSKFSALLFGMLATVGAWANPGVTNASSGFTADVENYIQEKVLPLSVRYLVAYQFGQALRLPKNRGVTYTASRYTRLPLPLTPLVEGVTPPGEVLTLQQVTATAQQWGDTVNVTDVADLTIKHPLFEQAIRLIAMQMPETLERNTFNTLLAGSNVNYANAKTSRALLTAADTMTIAEVNKIQASFLAYGVPHYMGDEREDVMKNADRNESAALRKHYVALIHPFALQDMRQSSTVLNAWSYSDVDRLYSDELGDLNGVRFCVSNMIPIWTGQAAINGVGNGVGGALAAGNYFVQVTGSPVQTNVEQNIYQVSAVVAVGGAGAGSIQVTLPNVPNFVFNVYVGTTAAPSNLGLTPSGPVVGTLAGNAVTLTGNQTITITAIGAAQTPPAAPATGVTVAPTIFLGRDAYGQVMLQDAEFFYLRNADKSDKLNQLRVCGWKVMYGTIILNQGFFARTEAGTSFTGGYNNGVIVPTPT